MMSRPECVPASDEPRRPGRPRDPQADEQIVHAAVDVLTEQGFSGFTVEAVALRAGVGKATIYRRWANREELVTHVVAKFMTGIVAPDTGSIRGDLIEWFYGRYKKKSVLRNNQLMGHALVEASVNDEIHALMRSFSAKRRDAFFAVVQRAVARGELPENVDADVMLDLLSGAMLYRSMFTDATLTPASVAALVDVVLAGVTTVASSGQPEAQDRSS